MSSQRRFEELLADWLEDQPARAPDGLLQAVLADLPVTVQRGRWRARLRRIPRYLPGRLQLAGTVAALALAIIVTFSLWNIRGLVGPAPTGSPGPTEPSPSATVGQSPAPTPSPAPDGSFVLPLTDGGQLTFDYRLPQGVALTVDEVAGVLTFSERVPDGPARGCPSGENRPACDMYVAVADVTGATLHGGNGVTTSPAGFFEIIDRWRLGSFDFEVDRLSPTTLAGFPALAADVFGPGGGFWYLEMGEASHLIFLPGGSQLVVADIEDRTVLVQVRPTARSASDPAAAERWLTIAGAFVDSLSVRAGASPDPGATPIATPAAWPSPAPLGEVEACAAPGRGNVTVATIETSGPPAHLVVYDGSAWVATTTAATVDRIDLATNQVTASIPVGVPTTAGGGSVMAVAVDHYQGLIWAAVRSPANERKLVAINPATNETVEEIPVPFAAYDMVVIDRHDPLTATDHQEAWISDFDGSRVGVVDLVTGEVRHDLPIPGGTVGLAHGVETGALWVPNNAGNSVTAISNYADPALRQVVAVERPTYLAAVANEVWGVNGRGQLFVVDQADRVSVFTVDQSTNHIASASGHLFVNVYHPDRPAELVQLDVDGAAPCVAGRHDYPAGTSDPWLLSYGNSGASGVVWAGNQSASTLVRFDISSLP